VPRFVTRALDPYFVTTKGTKRNRTGVAHTPRDIEADNIVKEGLRYIVDHGQNFPACLDFNPSMTGLYFIIGFCSQYRDLIILKIRNGLSKVLLIYPFIELGSDTEKGEDVICAKNTPKPHQWVIKRHSEAAQCYMLVSHRPLFKHRPSLFFTLSTLLLKINCFGAFRMPCHHWNSLCHIL
jgi:hypothetical protein